MENQPTITTKGVMIFSAAGLFILAVWLSAVWCRPAEGAAPDCTAGRIVGTPSPVVLANVLYTAFPPGDGQQSTADARRGKMAAVRIYDPEVPDETLTGDQVLWEAGRILAAVDPDERRIFFAHENVLKPFTAGTVTSRMLALEAAAEQALHDRWDVNADGVIDDADAAWLVQWVRGRHRSAGGQIKHWLLGPVDRSVPAIMVPPKAPGWLSSLRADDLPRASFRRFQSEHRRRQTVLFVGSGNGMLHAFEAGSFRWGDNPATADTREQRGYFSWEPKQPDAPDHCFAYDSICPNYGSGQELWAFIPSNLLPRLKYHLRDGGDAADMNASAAIADVFVDTDGDGGPDAWKTVLVSAQGSGGDGVFCLDVTAPHHPRLMWEFTAPQLVRRHVMPAVVRIIRILDTHDGRPRWAALLAAGAVKTGHGFPAVWMLDIATGRLLEKVVLDAAADRVADGRLQSSETDAGRGATAGSRPAAVDTDGNGLVDRIYVTADNGRVYKIVLPDQPGATAAGIRRCVLNTDFTDANGKPVPTDQRFKPILASPTVAVDDGSKTDGKGRQRVWIFFGTGGKGSDDPLAPGADIRHHFFAYTDTDANSDCSPRHHQLQWFVALPPGEQVISSAFAAAGQVVFGSADVASIDPCGSAATLPAEEKAGLFVLDFEGEVLFRKSMPAVLSAPLVEDLHLYLTLPGGPLSFGPGLYNNQLQAVGKPRVRLKAWQLID